MPARLLITIVFMVLISGSASYGFDPDPKVECNKTKQKIREIQSRMRSGYTRAQGEKMEAQLRKLRSKRKKVCR